MDMQVSRMTFDSRSLILEFLNSHDVTYRIYSAIRWGFLSLERLQITKSALRKFAMMRVMYTS